jgi:hypothetical protein
VFQLFPQGWRFAEGHVPKLERLPKDSNAGLIGGYGRASDNQQPVTVKQLELRLPVVQKPGALKGLIGAMAEKFLPNGYELASDFAGLASPEPKAKGKFKAKGSNLVGKLKCPGAYAACNAIEVTATANKSSKKKVKVATGKLKKVAGGKSKKLKLKLTGKGRKLLAEESKLKLTLEIEAAELAEPVIQKAKAK